jgi:hypothetical protein
MSFFPVVEAGIVLLRPAGGFVTLPGRSFVVTVIAAVLGLMAITVVVATAAVVRGMLLARAPLLLSEEQPPARVLHSVDGLIFLHNEEASVELLNRNCLDVK